MRKLGHVILVLMSILIVYYAHREQHAHHAIQDIKEQHANYAAQNIICQTTAQ